MPLETKTLPTQLWLGGPGEPKADKIPEIKNEPRFVKPRGGMWTSTYNEESGSSWLQFLLSEYREGLPKNTGWLLMPTRCRVFTIDTLQDLEEAVARWTVPQIPELEKIDFFKHLIDFEAAQKEVDAIHLTEEGQWRTRLEIPNLYGWDSESTLWFRCFFQQGLTKINLKRFKAHD